MTSTTDTTVHKALVVNVPIDEAFRVFTDRFGDFRASEHNLMNSPIAQTVFEGKVGGHIYDRAEDGSECHWARILIYEPPTRVVFSWDIGPTWQLHTTPTTPAKSRSAWPPRRPTAHVLSSSTATSTGMALAGRASAPASTRDGRSTSTATQQCSPDQECPATEPTRIRSSRPRSSARNRQGITRSHRVQATREPRGAAPREHLEGAYKDASLVQLRRRKRASLEPRS